MDFCNLKSQYDEYKTEIDQAIAEVLKSAYFVGGPAVGQLETTLSEFTGSSAISCANGTDALQLALMALDIGPGDEVITTPFTFFATSEMIAALGAKPVFVDISEEDFNIDATKIEQAISPKTKAILPVSLFGQTPDMDLINDIAEIHKITVIEDAAQSFGGTYKGKRSCNLSNLATTSFFPAKPLGCYGDGGAVFTTDEDLNKKIRLLKNHGQNERYCHSHIGVNSRLDTIQAAVLLVKMKYYEAEIKRRQASADRYTELLGSQFICPNVVKGRTSVWAQYTLRVENRNELQAKLNENKIPSAVHYPMPLHFQACFKDLGLKKGDLPVAEKMANEVISLPMSAHLSLEDQDQVIEVLLKA